MRNNFPHYNFFRLGAEFELEIREGSIIWNSIEFDGFRIELSRIDEIWTRSYYLYLDNTPTHENNSTF
jgi:hypothetical protein